MAYAAASDVVLYADFSASDDDALLTLLIQRATAIIEAETGRVFEAASDIRYFDATEDVDGYFLYLDKDLIGAVSDVTITNGNGSDLSTDDFILVPQNNPHYAVKILGEANKSWTYDSNPERAIKIDGLWGYSSNAPNDIKHATIRLVSWLYKQRETDIDLERPVLTGDGVTIMPARMPHDVQGIIAKYRKRRIAVV